MSDYRMTETAKREYINSFQYFLENRTEFDDSVKEILVNEMHNIVNATDHYPSSGTIDLSEVGLEKDEDELVKLTSACIDYELFFDDSITVVFSSKLMYKPAIPGADEFIEESNLKRFNVPYGMYSFTYEGDAYEEM